MEQVFFRLHVRCVSTITSFVSGRTRTAIEHSLFLGAVVLSICLVALHCQYVVPTDGGCLRDLELPTSSTSAKSPSQSAEPQLYPDTSPTTSPSSSPRDPVSPESAGLDVEGHGRSSASRGSDERSRPLWRRRRDGSGPSTPAGAVGIAAQGQSLQGSLGPLADDVWTYLYSLDKGWLLLSQEALARHNVTVKSLVLQKDEDCLGPQYLQRLLHTIIGHDTVVMNWAISRSEGHGFLYSGVSHELYNLNYAEEFVQSRTDRGKFVVFKLGVLCTTLFLFFITTTLVSFTLRETQERMLKFTFLLQHHVRHRLSYVALIATHLVESLVYVPIMVGILFFLFEFFSDQLLAFFVLSMIWICEVYSVISVRTALTIRFFPRIFFLYFTLFHVYFFSFPSGFSHLALLTTMSLLVHAMLYFWNRFEIPALQGGAVTAMRPRGASVFTTVRGNATVSVRSLRLGDLRTETLFTQDAPGSHDLTAPIAPASPSTAASAPVSVPTTVAIPAAGLEEAIAAFPGTGDEASRYSDEGGLVDRFLSADEEFLEDDLDGDVGLSLDDDEEVVLEEKRQQPPGAGKSAGIPAAAVASPVVSSTLPPTLSINPGSEHEPLTLNITASTDLSNHPPSSASAAATAAAVATMNLGGKIEHGKN